MFDGLGEFLTQVWNFMNELVLVENFSPLGDLTLLGLILGVMAFEILMIALDIILGNAKQYNDSGGKK